MIDRTQIHFKEGVAYPVHNFDSFEQTSLPTPLIFSREGKHFYYSISNLDVQKVPVVTSIPYSENWYHFIFEGLSAFFRQEHDIVKSPILVRDTCPKNIAQLLTYLTGYEPVVLKNRSSILAEKLFIIQEWQYRNRFDFNSRANDITEIKFRLAQVFRSNHSTRMAIQAHAGNKNPIIFLKRPFGIFRQMINYCEALEVLKERSITIVDPSTLDLYECYSLVHNAKVVIVETGAAMTNLLFCQSGTKILEINPDGFEPFFWSGLTKILELDHQRISAHSKNGTFNQKFIFPINDSNFMITKNL
jgi:capsular polysaccharide biosynthesis protein